MINREVARSKMRDQKLSISELARRMNRHRPDVSAWVNGKRSPQLDTAKELANHLKCKIDDLVA